MKKSLLIITLTLCNIGQIYGFGDYYHEQAALQIAREKAIEIAERARLNAQRDFEAFLALCAGICKGISYTILSTGKVICQCQIDDTTEKIVGTIGVVGIAVASGIGIYKLYKSFTEEKEKRSNPETTNLILITN